MSAWDALQGWDALALILGYAVMAAVAWCGGCFLLGGLVYGLWKWTRR